MNNRKTKRVQFPVKRKRLADGTEQKYCQCDGCFNVTTVCVIKFPKTCYYNGKDLSTKYTERWYCDNCLGKLFKNIRKERAQHIFIADADKKDNA